MANSKEQGSSPTVNVSGELRERVERRRSFATAELGMERVKAIGASRMDERHAQLDKILEDDK